ncbi:MAG: hypothetical protein QOD56_1374, partial [Gammaproteobacteria bacterium]|nr:hypothetical protein [Gammaproteobacteria bacterium]
RKLLPADTPFTSREARVAVLRARVRGAKLRRMW